jgi:NhaP-type Na+/H+ or K+/H+ antiporter
MDFYSTSKTRHVLEHFKHIFSQVFQTLLFLFLIALLIQQFYPSWINSRININGFMFAVILFGAISILFPPKHEKHSEKPANWKDFIFILLLGIIGGIIIFLKIKSLGWIGYVISILGGLIIILLSWLILTEKEDNDDS